MLLHKTGAAHCVFLRYTKHTRSHQLVKGQGSIFAQQHSLLVMQTSACLRETAAVHATNERGKNWPQIYFLLFFAGPIRRVKAQGPFSGKRAIAIDLGGHPTSMSDLKTHSKIFDFVTICRYMLERSMQQVELWIASHVFQFPSLNHTYSKCWYMSWAKIARKINISEGSTVG